LPGDDLSQAGQAAVPLQQPPRDGAAPLITALVREPSPEIGRCELSHLDRIPIDVPRAIRQHEQYVSALARAGCAIERLPPVPELPDGVFVEDTALVLEELAVITRPGAESRRPETESVAAALEPFRPLRRIGGPGTLDGGDVLHTGRSLFVGISGRTTREGAAELARLVAPAGYQVRMVPVRGCLHLKSAVTEVGDATLLINPEWVDPAGFEGFRLIPTDPDEAFAANALRIGTQVIHAAAFPRTGRRLRAEGFEVHEVEADELAKAEGGVTCCSLLIADSG
jgi:dimethylargininase